MATNRTAFDPSAYQVLAGGKYYSSDLLRDKPWTPQLSKELLDVKRGGASCLCCEQQGLLLPLSIKGGLEEEVSATDGYATRKRKKRAVHLSPFPNTSHLHALDCMFWGTHASPTTAINMAAIKELSSGEAEISADISFAVAARRPGGPREDDKVPEATAAQQNRIGIVGILNYLLERSGLHRHGPDTARRTQTSVAARMQEESLRITINGNHLWPNLHLPGSMHAGDSDGDLFRLSWYRAKHIMKQPQQGGRSRP